MQDAAKLRPLLTHIVNCLCLLLQLDKYINSESLPIS